MRGENSGSLYFMSIVKASISQHAPHSRHPGDRDTVILLSSPHTGILQSHDDGEHLLNACVLYKISVEELIDNNRSTAHICSCVTRQHVSVRLGPCITPTCGPHKSQTRDH